MLPIILAIKDENDRMYVGHIYEQYKTKLFAVAHMHLMRPQDCEDCVQDLVVVLIDKLEVFQEMSELHQKNFLVKVCRCIAINKYKENMRQASMEVQWSDDVLENTVADGEPPLDKWMLSEENVRQITQTMEDMDPRYGDILYLKGFLHMTNAEIAKVTGLTVGAVGTRLMRARRQLLSRKGDDTNDAQ